MTETVKQGTATVITVQGRHSERYPAERATVRLSVNYDGSKREPVFAEAIATAETLREALTSLHDATAGPVVSWSSDAVRVWGDRPWNNEGKQLAMVYHAVINFTAKFSDFDALSRFVESSATTNGVTIGSLDWALTEPRQLAVDTEVRTGAVADAVSKATAYAHAIGLSSVTATAIADPGMLSEQSGGSGGNGYELSSASRSFMKMDVGGGAQLSLNPEDIEVSAAVDARFVAN